MILKKNVARNFKQQKKYNQAKTTKILGNGIIFTELKMELKSYVLVLAKTEFYAGKTADISWHQQICYQISSFQNMNNRKKFKTTLSILALTPLPYKMNCYKADEN